MTYADMGIQFLPVNHKVPHGDQCAYTLGSVPLYKLADVVNDAMKRPAPAQAEPIGYFIKQSGFGPWIEVEPTTLHAKPLYEAPAAPVQAEPVTVEDTRAAFEETMRRLSNGEPNWDSPAALWAYAAWNARGIFDAKALAAPNR